MHFQSFVLVLASLGAAVATVCWNSPMGILLRQPPRVGLFGPPAKPGDCSLPVSGGGGGPAPAPKPLTITVSGPTVTACTSTVSACTATACTATETACTATSTAYQLNPASLAAGSSACSGAYGTARPTPLFNPAGKPKCCAPIQERTPAGLLVAQCLG